MLFSSSYTFDLIVNKLPNHLLMNSGQSLGLLVAVVLAAIEVQQQAAASAPSPPSPPFTFSSHRRKVYTQDQ